MSRPIVMLAVDCDTTRIVYHYISQYFEVSKVILEEPVSKKKLLKNRVRKLGLLKVMGQLGFLVLVNPILKRKAESRKRYILDQYKLSVDALPEKKIVRINSVNSEAARALLLEIDPELILVNGTRIIGKNTLNSTAAPFVNIHTGITPMFRGVHGGYWAIATGKKELFGTTIHIVDAGVDTGAVLKQVVTVPGREDNFASYPLLQYAICLPELKKIVANFVASKEFSFEKALTNESRQWYHPTLLEYLLGKNV
jgi:folate-dependent phosphoribosylglycinamide formyltransferase PurN